MQDTILTQGNEHPRVLKIRVSTCALYFCTMNAYLLQAKAERKALQNQVLELRGNIR